MTKCRRVVVSRYGGPEVLEVVEDTLPEPQPGEVRMLVVFLLGVAGAYAISVGVIPVQRIMASSAAVVGVLLLLTCTCYRTRNRERLALPGLSE